MHRKSKCGETGTINGQSTNQTNKLLLVWRYSGALLSWVMELFVDCTVDEL